MAFRSFLIFAIRIARGLVSLSLFALFGVGAVFISLLMPFLGGIERRQRTVRFAWRILLATFEATGLVRVDSAGAPKCRGSVIVSNHPSLIDVVIYIALVPKTLYVAKSALLGNPFMSMIVRSTSLPDDETLPKTAKTYLENGWNVLVFPEGTRSPDNGLWPFRRGAAHVALEAGAPIVVSSLALSRKILGKRQKPWEMGEERVVYSILSDPPMAVSQKCGESRHAAAKRITSDLEAAMLGRNLS